MIDITELREFESKRQRYREFQSLHDALSAGISSVHAVIITGKEEKIVLRNNATLKNSILNKLTQKITDLETEFTNKGITF